MLLLLLACTPNRSSADPEKEDVSVLDTSVDTGDSNLDDTDTSIANPWTVLVYMDGDNNLESWVLHDLNELEAGMPTSGVKVLVQADRAEGYATGDGDWTGTRRYEIVPDGESKTIISPVLEEMGEADMGDPQTLSDFLLWGWDRAPAQHLVVVMWDHGTSWSMSGAPPPPPGVATDDESSNEISVARGELRGGLKPLADIHPIDILAFDACNMASWEVAYSVAPLAQYFTAAETTVGVQGLQYTPLLAAIGENPAITPREVVEKMAQDAVTDGKESTFSALDLAGIEDLTSGLDNLASAALNDAGVYNALMAARSRSRGVEKQPYGYLDLRDLLNQSSADGTLADTISPLQSAMDRTVVASFGQDSFDWVGGMTIYFDSWKLDLYGRGRWATATHWDELLHTLPGH